MSCLVIIGQVIWCTRCFTYSISFNLYFNHRKLVSSVFTEKRIKFQCNERICQSHQCEMVRPGFKPPSCLQSLLIISFPNIWYLTLEAILLSFIVKQTKTRDSELFLHALCQQKINELGDSMLTSCWGWRVRDFRVIHSGGKRLTSLKKVLFQWNPLFVTLDTKP